MTPGWGRWDWWWGIGLVVVIPRLLSAGITCAIASTNNPAMDSPPRLAIDNHPDSVTLSWDPQPSPTEILTGFQWSPEGQLVDARVAVDKDFDPVGDAGYVGQSVRFEVLKNSSLAFFAPKRSLASNSPAGLRLDGSFIQYQPWMKTLDAAAWQKELEAMKRADLRLVFIQWVQYNQTRFLPDTHTEPDPTEHILAFADRQGLRVFLGLAMDDLWWNQSTEASYLKRTADTLEQIAEEIWRRYGTHASFAGWYIPQETWDGTYTESQTSLLRAFFRRVSDRCKALSGGKPVSFSPFFSGLTTASATGTFYRKLLEGAGLDILLLQDGVGARGWDNEIADRVIPYFTALASACLATGVAFWSDLESFQLVNEDPVQYAPAGLERLRQQLAIESPFVQQVITFDFFHYLSPHRGSVQQKLYQDYLLTCIDRPDLPAFGRSVEIDPQFHYYRERSPLSIASEIRANGYAIVRYILTADSNVQPELISAFQREGLGVWYATFANGTYTTKDLPPDWSDWQMVTRSDLEGHPLQDGYTRLCLNHPAYRAWKKTQVGRMLQNYSFQGIDLMEPHWPEYPGSDSPAYACFCPACQQAFHQMFPDEDALPDILDPTSPRSPARHPALWQKWLEFRRRSLIDFLNDLVNGDQGIRSRAPQTPVCVWTLALTATNGLAQVREIHGEDPGEIARIVKPDLLCLQTHWPDWIRADLRPDYVLNYKPFLQAVRAQATNLPIMIQADVGSQTQNRRSWTWIRDFERACRRLGATDSTFYEYFIGNYMYTDRPQIVALRCVGDEIELRFSKRMDATTATNASHYQLSSGQILEAKCDGNRILLKTQGIGTLTQTTLTVRGLIDDTARRLFSDRPPATLVEQIVRLR